MIGDDNEIDHNTFRNKDTEGQMFQVHGPGDRAMAQRTWIHHNHFHDFRNSRRNNSSALHIGNSGRSMSSSYCVVEHNLFVRTRGENEGAICNKATDNIYRFNTFGEDSTELSLRHGMRCLVYGNFFLGGNGLRFFSHDHRIFSNYFENCRPAIAIGNGGATIPPGPLTSHERPDRVQVVYNTLVNNRANVRMSRRRNGLGANDLVFANNIIVGGDEAVSIDGPLANPTWEGNIVWANEGGAGDIPSEWFHRNRSQVGIRRQRQLQDSGEQPGGWSRYRLVSFCNRGYRRPGDSRSEGRGCGSSLHGTRLQSGSHGERCRTECSGGGTATNLCTRKLTVSGFWIVEVNRLLRCVSRLRCRQESSGTSER